MNTLVIDTSSNKEVTIALIARGKKYEEKQEIGVQKAQVVLPLIDKLLKKHNVSLKDIDEIEVNTGPGSFTGLRVGISIANALAWTLKIPVNGKEQVVAIYD